MTSTLQALSLVEKAELVQVHFTLHLRDQRSMCMQDGCQVYMDSYMASNGSCFVVTGLCSKTTSWRQVQHKTKRPWYSERSQSLILFYHAWGPEWIEIHWNIKLVEGPITLASHYTWGSVTIVHDVGGLMGRPLDTFFWALRIAWSWLLACVWSGPYM